VVVAVIFLIACIIVAVLAGGLLAWRRANPKPDEGTYQVMVGLHLIRRRFDVSQFKVELRRDAADRRRQLRDELNELHKRERQP
jgi:hypothetical protein